MIFIEYLRDFMDIEDKYLAYTEFMHKYGNTWVYVNDLLFKIIPDGCNETRLSTNKKDFTDIYSIKPFNPKVGLYFNQKDNIYIYVKKYADRQFKKSFCHSTYSVENLFGKKDVVTPSKEYFVNNYSELIYLKNDFLLLDNYVFYRDHCIGKITDLGEFHTHKYYSFLLKKVEQTCKKNLQLVTY